MIPFLLLCYGMSLEPSLERREDIYPSFHSLHRPQAFGVAVPSSWNPSSGSAFQVDSSQVG